ncbi:MAG: prolipoprotein diacylglyceryl transferase [Sphingobacteriales bacterium JAD_PAG50586_3]|nr:MAG: prolipoprotein diacylglyceryl transferase [Sphingobacteriales bacterium JAD_PAG50586_3]
MYPNFRELFYYTLGVDIPALAVVNTFGFFVAMAFVVAAWLLSKELKRKEAEGLISSSKRKVVVGQPASVIDMGTSGLLGFLIGFKVLGMIFNMDWEHQTPQQFIISTQGNIIGGLLFGGLFAYLTWKDKEKTKLAQPKEETITVHPYQLVGNITVIAAVSGILGAKIFHHLENWDDFIKDPVGQLSDFFGGLTFYGGLICATICVLWYLRRNNIKAVHMFDAAAPVLIVAYGVGRIGCMVAGDGDWGVINSAYRVDGDRNYTTVSLPDTTIKKELATYYPYFEANSPEEVPHIHFEKPGALGFLPDQFFAYDFPHNVLERGVPLNNTPREQFRNHLPLPVFPTAFYEVLMALAIFGFLWSIRKRIKTPGMLFGIYLMFNGLERFLIESIRVNTKMHFLGMVVTQAQLISTILFLVGVALTAYTYSIYKRKKA